MIGFDSQRQHSGDSVIWEITYHFSCRFYLQGIVERGKSGQVNCDHLNRYDLGSSLFRLRPRDPSGYRNSHSIPQMNSLRESFVHPSSFSAQNLSAGGFCTGIESDEIPARGC